MPQNELHLTRRSFVGAAAAVVGSGSLASWGMLSGCSGGSKSGNGGTGSAGNAVDPSASSAFAELNPQEDYTSYTTDYSAIFQPMELGSLKLRNRIVKSPAGSDTWAPVGDALNDNYLDYYENFAKGGASLVFLESAIAKMQSMSVKGHTVSGWLLEDMSKIPQMLAPVIERVHAHDAYIGWQMGAPSGSVADVTLEDIAWQQAMMVEVALKLQEAGIDIIQLHCSATQFMKYMLTGRENTRTDQYGWDSVENRTRFTCEVIKKLKSALGADFPIQILMDAAEDNDASIGDNDKFITLAESIENAKAFEKAGADTFYLRMSVPGYHVSQFAPDIMFSGYKCEGLTGFGARFDFSQHFSGAINGQYSGCAMLLNAASEFKKHLKASVSCAGYMDPRTAPDLMNNAIANGEIDYLMITRPLTVDPELPNKLMAGKRDEVAPCCRCMYCHNKGGPEEAGPEWCRVNAATQHAYTDLMPEGYDPLPAENPKKVLVVGGGPAGMEAARIAAQRGHEVSLYEKDGFLGGLIKTAHAYKGDHERLGDLVDYLVRQQEVCGVKVVTGTEVDASTIEQENPDAVLIAVGGLRDSKLSSVGATHVLAVDDLINSDIGENVVICGAGIQAIDVAFYLLAQGKKIQIVHSGAKESVDKERSMWAKYYLRPYLYQNGVKIWNSAIIGSVVDGGLNIVSESKTDEFLACDTVIECYDMVPNTDLYDSISAKYETYAIGDCNAPFNIADAILAGNLTARAL